MSQPHAEAASACPNSGREALARGASLPALTSLRFVAAFAVVLHHLADFTPAAPHWAIAARGGLAVDFFFMLSGFILLHAHEDEVRARTISTRNFLQARLARVYPAHFVMLTAFVVVVLGARMSGSTINAERYGLWSLFTHLTLTNAWGLDTVLSWNYPAWSISAEWAAYLGFIPMAFLALRLSRAQAGIALALLLACFIALAPRYDLTQRTLEALPRIFPEFAMGMLARRVFPPAPGRGATALFLAGCVGVAAGLTFGIPDVWLVAVFLLVIVTGARLEGPVAAVMAKRTFVRLGEESYSLYLVHIFVFGITFKAAAAFARFGLPDWSLSIAAVAAAIAAAAALHRFVEVPANAALRPRRRHV